MGYRRYKPNDKDLIFAEYFNDEISVRRNGGIPTDVTFDKGVAEFNGGSSLINFDHKLYGNQSLSIRIRFKKDSLSAIGYLFDFRSSGGTLGSGFAYIAATTGVLVKQLGSAEYLNGVLDASPTIVVDTWYDYVITGATYKTGTGANPFIVGTYRVVNSNWFDGGISLIEIYNRALTAEEVSNLYNSSRYKVPQLNTATLSQILDVSARSGVVRNKFSGDTIGGNLVPEVVNTSMAVHKEGSIRTMLFDGNSSKVDAGSYYDLTGDITVLAWVKPRSYGEGGAFSSYMLSNLQLVLGMQESNTRYFFVSAGLITFAYSAAGSVTINEYQLLIITRTASGIANFYIDGENNGTVDQSSGTPVAGTENIHIGNRFTATESFDGLISEVKVLSGLMTAQEISRYYSSTRHLYK